MEEKIKQIDDEILANGVVKSLRAGEVLIQKNDHASCLFYVKNGSLLVLNDNSHSIVNQNSYIDPLPVFSSSYYPFMVIAKENSEVICVNTKESPNSKVMLFLYIQRKSMFSESNVSNFE
ncbi:MAG: cyclic nucleotide-binding domain-containing protein [Cytophagales bacterium]